MKLHLYVPDKFSIQFSLEQSWKKEQNRSRRQIKIYECNLRKTHFGQIFSFHCCFQIFPRQDSAHVQQLLEMLQMQPRAHCRSHKLYLHTSEPLPQPRTTRLCNSGPGLASLWSHILDISTLSTDTMNMGGGVSNNVT